MKQRMMSFANGKAIQKWEWLGGQGKVNEFICYVPVPASHDEYTIMFSKHVLRNVKKENKTELS